MATTNKQKNQTSSYYKSVSTKPTVELPSWDPKTYSSKTFNKDMPYAYKPNTITADVYDGPTFNPQEYVSNYKPQNYQSSYTPGQFTDTYEPGQYQSAYLPRIDAALNNVTNWKYDPLQDASYQALAQVYGARGNLAAKNSLADAAALNGGYGTSYATSAAQQARNQYNQELMSMIPQLEQAAYQRAQGNLDALMGMDNMLYGRFSDDQSRQLAAKQFGLDAFNTNEGIKQFAAQLGYDYDKLNQEEKQFIEKNAQDVFNMNTDNTLKAVQNAMDIFGMNTANKQFAQTYNQDENQFAYNSKWDRYNAKNQNRQFVAGLNNSNEQFGFNAGMDLADLLTNYYQWATGTNFDFGKYKEALKNKGGSGGGGGGSRSGGGGSGGGYVDTGSTVTTNEDLYNKAKKKSVSTVKKPIEGTATGTLTKLRKTK